MSVAGLMLLPLQPQAYAHARTHPPVSSGDRARGGAQGWAGYRHITWKGGGPHTEPPTTSVGDTPTLVRL